MYPWQGALTSWAQSTNLQVDALGIVTMLGAEEIDRSVGRLMSSRYVDFLPLLGAFVIASNRFTHKKPGFTLYNLTSGIQTTELAGWFTRWIQAQDFSQVRDVVEWQVAARPLRARHFVLGLLLVGVPLNGILVALTVLSGDWWGFANAMAMVLSVAVRLALVAQVREGIDKTVARANTAARERYAGSLESYKKKMREFESLGVSFTKEKRPDPPASPFIIAKTIIVTDDSKVITVRAPDYLIGPVFTKNPEVPHPWLYMVTRYIGWAAFALHIVSLGMAALVTQIYTVVLIMMATVLSTYKIGCDDWKLGAKAKRTTERKTKDVESNEMAHTPRCWVSSTLGAHCSQYPGSEKSARRQDLYVWLEPDESELDLMKDWYLIPHKNNSWMAELEKKQVEHRQKLTEQKRRSTI
ncbi:hypothetical protein F4779DRAFT_418493 [Xylariaceae sp. FL0662B]|nr:hypothetical protein F4779DRAFT_418493 [Xylariaceae sp. FL0662B]